MRKATRQQRSEARLLWQAILHDGHPDPDRIRTAIKMLGRQPGRNTEAVLHILVERLEAYMRSQQIRVVSADELSADQREQLTRLFPHAETAGSNIQFDTDPAVLGGLRVENGYQMVDRTVVRQMDILKSMLLKL